MSGKNITLLIMIITIIFLIFICCKCIDKYNKENFLKNIHNNNFRLSVIILNYNRPQNIKKLIPELKKLNVIDDIIISNGKKETEVLFDDPIITNETTLRNKYFSATRFEIAKMAKNEFILFLDDDLYPSTYLISDMLKKITSDGFNNKYNLYGPFKRFCGDKYIRNDPKYNMVLTGLSIINKKMAIKVWEKIKETKYIDIIMENKGNGEDIIFSNFVKLFGGENKYVSGEYHFLDNKNGYSSNEKHYKKRSELCKIINKDIKKNYFGQIIEKNIIQTSYHKNIQDMDINIIKNIVKIRKLNPEYNYYYFNNEDAREFIKLNYDLETLYLFDNINDCYGAAKADFFRYLAIYKLGGIYIDIKSSFSKPLRKIINPYDEYLLSSWKSRKWHYKNKKTESYQSHLVKSGFGEFTQWNVIARKNHPFLKKVIENVKDKLRNPSNEIGKPVVLETTGPVIYSNTILEVINKSNNLNYTFKYNNFDNNLIYTIYKNHKIHRNKILTNNYRICDKKIMKFQN